MLAQLDGLCQSVVVSVLHLRRLPRMSCHNKKLSYVTLSRTLCMYVPVQGTTPTYVCIHLYSPDGQIFLSRPNNIFASIFTTEDTSQMSVWSCVYFPVVYFMHCFCYCGKSVVSAVSSADHLDQLEWQKKYVVLDKDDRKLYFFNDTEVGVIYRFKLQECYLLVAYHLAAQVKLFF